MAEDGSQETRLTYSTGSEERAPSISPNGRLIAFTSNIDGDEDIWIMNSDGSNPRQVTNRPGRDFRATWFPNSQRLTFTSEITGDGEIFATNIDGTNVERLSDDPTIDTDSVVDPSGQNVAYSSGSNASGTLTGSLGIYRVNVTTLAKTAVAVAGPPNGQNQVQHLRSANWSPDGQKITFEAALGPVGDAAGVGNADIYTIASNGAGGSIVQLTSAATNEDDPAFSPDNTQITFRSSQGGNSDIYKMSATTPSTVGQWTRLTSDAAADEDPWWGVAVAPTTNTLALSYISTRAATVRQNGNNSTTSFPGFIEAGDHDVSGHKTLQGFFGFGFSGLPSDPNKIVSAELVMTFNPDPITGSVGTPFSLGSLYVERIGISQYGSLNLSAPTPAVLKNTAEVTQQFGNEYSANVTSIIREHLRLGESEAAFRLRFTTPENNDGDNDIADFFATGLSQPTLIVRYLP